MSKRKAIEVSIPEHQDKLTIMPLGAGNEVGRSCIMLSFKGKSIMLDCGIHPAYSGLAGLPYFDEIEDPSKIDLLLISHFHLDHAASLPYFLEKTTFKGRVFTTHPTKAIYKMLLTDYVKVSNIAIDDILYNEEDLNNSMEKIEQINYHQELEHHGIKFWCYNAGHVLGAAMFMIEIAGVRILYTGDFSRQEDRHLMAAEIPEISPDILIVESTYGVQIHEPREEREHRFTKLVHDIVKRRGRCLIPVFALGRAQELLLILDEYWEAHPELHHIPIYYASTLAKRCMTVYQTYVNMMNEKIRKAFTVANPFNFKHISNLKNMSQFDDIGPSVVMASPAMLQSGLSRELFELWCTSKSNGIILPGYVVEGTLAKHIMSEPAEVPTSSGISVPLHMSVHYISFSAHSDFKQTSEFIDKLQPPHVVLVHGDSNEMMRLKNALTVRYEGKSIEVLTPRNCQTVEFTFKADRIAKAVGTLAANDPKDGTILSGILVEKDFDHHIMTPSDLPVFTQLATSTISQRQSVPYNQPLHVLKYNLSYFFDSVKSQQKNGKDGFVVHGAIEIMQDSLECIVLEWVSTPINDMLADSVLACILQIEACPTGAFAKKPKLEHEKQGYDHNIASFLEQQFSTSINSKDKAMEMLVDGCIVVLDEDLQSASSENAEIADYLTSLLCSATAATNPI